MTTDEQLEDLRDYIKLGKVTQFKHILKTIRKTTIRHILLITSARINKIVEDPAVMTGDEMIRLSKRIGISPLEFFQLVVNQKKSK